MISPVVLWSDILIFSLALCVGLFIFQVRKKPQARARWRGVFESKIGLTSFIVIVFYVLISLMDSVHFREQLTQIETEGTGQNPAYSSEVKSVLDIALTNLNSTAETTYSAPFSLYSFSKENIKNDDGSVYRDFIRLKHGGAHIQEEKQRFSDILIKSVQAILIGLLIAAIPVILHIMMRKKSNPEEDYVPWNVAYCTIITLISLATWVIILSQYYHILGTDKVGQDVLYQSIKSIRTGVLIGTLATLVTLPFAIILGISAGYFKGWVDDTVQFIYTTLSSIPGILLIAASVLLIDVYIETNPDKFNLTILRSDFKFIALCAILGLTSWTTLCRMLRAETLKVSQLDYVQAAHAFGVSHRGVIGKHILPNVTHIILIAVVLDFSAFVLAEAVLSYIGVGVDPNMYSWGNMINAARSELSRDPTVWWSVTSAFILMFTLVLAANLFSDEVRNAFDPRTAKGNE